MAWIEIDGGHLEGGGQILRTAVGLSAATGKPCRIHNIRKGRRGPGLAAQHLSGVTAVGRLCDAEVTGARLGSTELTFHPRRLAPPDELSARVGTAGSVTLVLQGLLIPLAAARVKTEVTVSGGTHVKWSPTADYFRRVFAPWVRKMGLEVLPLALQPGFYPRGGGRLSVEVSGRPLSALVATDPGRHLRTFACSVATVDLAEARVAERQLEGAEDVMRTDRPEFHYVAAASTGTAVLMVAECENGLLGASTLGERGKRAEKVGAECARELMQLLECGACLDSHMADQILPYLALADGPSEVRVAALTDHCRTNIWVIEQFLPARFEVDEAAGMIRCRP